MAHAGVPNADRGPPDVFGRGGRHAPGAVPGACRARHIRSDNGPERIARRLKAWRQGFNVDHEYIERGKP